MLPVLGLSNFIKQQAVQPSQMKKSILLILLAAIMLGSWGCGKQKLHDNKNFWVTVQERGTGKAIPNAEVVALEYVSTGILMGGDYNRLGVFTTDQNGRVFIEGGEREVSQLRIRTGLDYYDMDQGSSWITYVNQSFVESDPKIVELIPFAWLKLSIDFSIYQGEFDYVSYQITGICTGSIGAGTRVSEACQVRGNTPFDVYFYGYKDGKQVKTWQNAVYPPGHDTLVHVATYTP